MEYQIQNGQLVFKLAPSRFSVVTNEIEMMLLTTRYGLNSVRYDGARLWNKSENKLKVDDIKTFKQLLKEFK